MRNKEIWKTRITDCAFSLFNSYNENETLLNLTPGEFAALKSLSKSKNLSDIGKSVAIIA